MHSVSSKQPSAISHEPSQKWTGRFAPSPTGPLHLGSLAAAVASFMIAKQKNGEWLIRIEDIDKNREVTGSTDSILSDLESYGLYWDREIFYQSENTEWHQHVIENLVKTGLLYKCCCSRKEVLERNNGVYDGFCRLEKNTIKTHKDVALKTSDEAIKIDFTRGKHTFHDEILEHQRFVSAGQKQDFIIKRRDNIFAYQLAVIADDLFQNINHVVRGQDILDSTPKQIFLYHCLHQARPKYYHIPLILDQNNLKLSKSLNSHSLKQVEFLQDQKKVIPKTEILLSVFKHLGQSIDKELKHLSPQEVIEYFVIHWDTSLVNNQSRLTMEKSNGH